MAKFAVLVVRDRVADAYHKPIFVQSVGVALRSFSDEVSRDHPDNAMFQHPADFDLIELGSYDDATASFELLPAPRLVINGSQVNTTK